MEKKNFTEVVIDGTIYKLGGYESTEYLQQVAGYINNKITEMKALDGYNHLPTSQKALMMELNAADDFFKAKKSVDKLEKELSEKDRELYGVKHDLVTLQVKMEEANRTILSLREESSDYQKRILELETRLSGVGSAAKKAAPSLKPQAGDQDQIEGQLSFDLKSGEEGSQDNKAEEGKTQDDKAEKEKSVEPEKDTGDVFRPGIYDKEEEGKTDKEKAPAGESAEKSAEQSARTFVPDASGREAMMRNARENFLNSSAYGKKRNRRH